MKPRWTLTAKLVATGITFLVLALLSIGLTLWVSWNLEGGAAAVNEAGRLRMMTYRMAFVLSAPGEAPAGAPAMAQAFDASLQLLASGDPSRPLFVPWSAYSHERFLRVREQWAGLRQEWFAPAAARTDVLRRADAFVGEVDGFVAAIELDLAGWTAVLHVFQLALMGLAIGSAVALMFAGYRLVLSPVARLQRGLAAVQHGDLATRIEVRGTDEFGLLAEGFNDMAQTLQSLYGSLEQRVREKTEGLELRRRRLADLYEVSAFLARTTQLDDLARGFAGHMRRIAQADAAAVRWSSEDNQRYILLASDNLPAEMLAQEQCLDTGACHCGQPQAQASTHTIPIRAEAPAPLGHCMRAGFRSIVTVPLKLHKQVLGELDLFYRTEAATGLEPEERELLDTLASNMAGAMESLRASALEREAAVAEERGLLASELHDSIAQSLAFLKIQVQLLREALRTGEEAATRRIIGELDTGLRESYADVRELLVHFRTRTSDEDIEPALATTLNKFSHQTGLPAELRMHGHGVALAPDVQVQVLHIVQEALSNVRKHARAHRVQLDVTTTPHWRFEVRDDGIGFDAGRDHPGHSSVGLRIMQERAQRIGATVSVESAPGAGCVVALDLPQAAAAQAAPQAAPQRDTLAA